MKVKKQKFGILSDGRKVHLYTVKNDYMSFSCMDYGCTVTSILLNNKNGTKTDLVLGFSTLQGYIDNNSCFGTVVGRFANRIGTGAFTLNGKKYNLDKNDGENTLHSGFNGYDKMLWHGEILEEKDRAGVRFTRFSPDGEQGFPGNVKLTVTYILDSNNNLIFSYNGETDAPTPINITNHSYFNLNGYGSVENQILKINSSEYLEVDENLIPTGKFINVTNTPFDFTNEKEIGQDISQISPGYDHCYITNNYKEHNKQCGVPLDDSKLTHFAQLKDPQTNREMNVYTNMEGCQVYTGNWIKGIVGKNGRIYENHDGICFETQTFQDSPNKINFPTCVLEPGQKLKAKTIFSFKF